MGHKTDRLRPGVPGAVSELFEKINWELFHKQKISLVTILGLSPHSLSHDFEIPEADASLILDHLGGILSLLDAFQDTASDVLGIEAANPPRSIEDEGGEEPAQEAGACAHCGSTEGRVEHGGYYSGLPVCDACNEYAEANGGARRPVDENTSLDLINASHTLEQLRDVLNDIAKHYGEANEMDYTDLPTFGGEEPEDTTGIWSWNEDSILTQDRVWMIEPRPVWADAECSDGTTIRRRINFEAAIEMMDDDIREAIHAKLAPCSRQAFMDAYCEAHRARYGQPFVVN